MAEKKKYPVSTTPKGALVYPHFNTADTKHADPGECGDFKGKLRLTDEQFAPLKAKLDALLATCLDDARDKDGSPLAGANRKKAEAKGLQKPYARPMDKEGNELPGVWDVNFKVKAEGFDRKSGEKYSNKPKQFDTANPPKAIDVQLRSGAEVKISYTVFPWATAALGYGVTLRPKAIQVYKLATSAGADADYYGFGSDEDGYEHEDGGASDFTQDGDYDAAKSGDAYQKTGAADFEDGDIPF
ncbi:hypothetical protein ACVIRO_001281 [Rhizobium ruizarguesonis]|uniref:hypothetical protein n=1 Tax=Rhizobium leguminosarum TaxID=384 RepID=UPI0004B40263|nr:hypothetical protein [Rhizobium leguminosarum]